MACRREQQSKYISSPEYKEKRREYDRQRWLNHREYLVAKNRSYYARRSDKINAQKRDYWSKNRDRMHEARDIWRKNNIARILHLNAMRKKQIKIATPKWADLNAIFLIYAEAGRLSTETGVKYHVDHVIPLKGDLVCGLHVHNNLRPLPGAENIRKKNRFDVDAQS